MPVAKIGIVPPTPSSSYGGLYRPSDFDSPTRYLFSPAPRVPKPTVKHSFVIRTTRRRGIFKPRLHVYACLRCRYTFLVDERHSLIVAVDRKAQPIPNPENSIRVATFHDGPCPAFKSSSPKLHMAVDQPRPKSGILTLIFRVVAKTRYPHFVESNLRPPTGIAPQDLLS
jgi:hypothetical protein